MPRVVTINRPDVVSLIEEAAAKLTDGNKTEAVARALRCMLDQETRSGSLFGAHKGSVRVAKDWDPTAPVIEPDTDAESGREIRR